MDTCRYTLTLAADVHPDAVSRLADLFNDARMVSVTGDVVTITSSGETGDGLRLAEAVTDQLQRWQLRLPFTLVEHDTPTTVGSVCRWAPHLGTHIQPWHHGGAWIEVATLARALDRFPDAALVDHLRCNVLAEAWLAVCPSVPNEG